MESKVYKAIVFLVLIVIPILFILLTAKIYELEQRVNEQEAILIIHKMDPKYHKAKTPKEI